MIATLPVSCADPVRCLETISAQLRAVKHSGQTVGAKALTELGGFAPPTLLHEASRLVTRQRFVNLVVTNVPGPQFPLYLGDRELTDMFPMVPLGSNLNLGMAIVSYNGTLNFGLVGRLQRPHDLEASRMTSSPRCRRSRPLRRRLDGAEPAEPWPGYDDQTVAAIAKRLHDAGEDVAAAVAILRARAQAPPGRPRATERAGAGAGARLTLTMTS